MRGKETRNTCKWEYFAGSFERAIESAEIQIAICDGVAISGPTVHSLARARTTVSCRLFLSKTVKPSTIYSHESSSKWCWTAAKHDHYDAGQTVWTLDSEACFISRWDGAVHAWWIQNAHNTFQHRETPIPQLDQENTCHIAKEWIADICLYHDVFVDELALTNRTGFRQMDIRGENPKSLFLYNKLSWERSTHPQSKEKTVVDSGFALAWTSTDEVGVYYGKGISQWGLAVRQCRHGPCHVS